MPYDQQESAFKYDASSSQKWSRGCGYMEIEDREKMKEQIFFVMSSVRLQENKIFAGKLLLLLNITHFVSKRNVLQNGNNWIKYD